MEKDMIKVLLVEDDEDDYQLTRELLFEIYGARVDLEWVSNYDVALERLKDKCHDVYLLDYRLGEHSGLDLLREARVLAIQDPIILLTGQGNTELGREAMRMGAADYLVKDSIDAPLLERALDYAIQRKEVQQTLQRHALTFNSIQDSVFFTDIEGRIIDWNPGAERMSGYSKAEALGRTPAFLQRPGEAESLAASIAEGLQRDGRWAGEMNYVRKDGTWALGATVVALMFDERGLPTGSLSTTHDITESRLSEESLLRHAQRQATIADLGQRALAYADISDLMHDAAKLVKQALDVEYSKVLELLPGSTELLLTAGAGWHKGAVKKTVVGAGLDSQAGYALQNGVPVLVQDLRTETRFSDTFLLEEHKVLSGMTVIIMGKTEPYGVLSAHSTRTRIFSTEEVQFLQAVANTLALSMERKGAEVALRDHTERLAEAQQLAHMGSWVWDIHDNQVTWSDEMFRIFGVEPQQFGATFQAYMGYVHPEDRARVGEDIERALREKGSFSHECRFVKPDGTVRNNHARGQTILDEAGNAVQMRGTAQDITERKQGEEELLRLQDRFSKAFNASPSPIAISRLADGQFVDVNDSYTEVFGFTREEVLGQRSTDLGIWVDVAARNNLVAALQESGSVHQMEIVVRNKSGAILDVLFSGDVIELEGEPCMLSIMVDITERKKSEEALRLSSEILQRVNSIVLVSNKVGQITYASPSVNRILGYEPQDLLGDGWWQITTRDSDEAEREILRVTDVVRSEDFVYRAPYERMVPDQAGKLHCILWQDVKGPGEQTIGVGHDITDHKRMEAEKEHLFSVSIDMMCIAGFDGYFKSVNPAFEIRLGMTSAQLLQKPFIEFVHADDRAATLAEMEKLSTGALTISFDNRYLCSDGSYKWLSWNSVPVYEQGLIYAVARDMTERKQAEAANVAREAAEAANLAKSEFLSRMSHELRTPLNAIIGFSQLLEMDELDPDQRESVELVHKAGRHLLDLINEILDISGIEAGHMSLSPEPVSVAEVLGECLDLIKPLAADKNIMLRARKALQSTLYVQADRQRLKQIILNLLSNAIKYNSVGGTVGLSCDGAIGGEHLTPGIGTDRVRISVRDTGSGIPLDKLAKLFIPFERLDADQSGVEGTGLGLALSKSLAEMMGGETGVESIVGQGSTFWVELPATNNPLELLDQFRGHSTGPLLPVLPLGPADQRTVLYIEDNSSNLRLIQHIFQQWPDIRLLSAMQGKLGFELACKHTPDLILLDLHLPDVHGEKVLEWLRRDPTTKDTPVVIITADATPREAIRLLELGANTYITKPIDVRHFSAVVRNTLDGKELTIAR